MTRSTALASLAVLAAFAVNPVAAQAPNGNGAAGFAASDTGNVVGGGGATMVGGGDDMVILYSSGGAGGGSGLRSQTPRLAAVTNGQVGAGSALSVQYMEPETAPPGREAWLVGGGDNAEVVYASPTRR